MLETFIGVKRDYYYFRYQCLEPFFRNKKDHLKKTVDGLEMKVRRFSLIKLLDEETFLPFSVWEKLSDKFYSSSDRLAKRKMTLTMNLSYLDELLSSFFPVRKILDSPTNSQNEKSFLSYEKLNRLFDVVQKSPSLQAILNKSAKKDKILTYALGGAYLTSFFIVALASIGFTVGTVAVAVSSFGAAAPEAVFILLLLAVLSDGYLFFSVFLGVCLENYLSSRETPSFQDLKEDLFSSRERLPQVLDKCAKNITCHKEKNQKKLAHLRDLQMSPKNSTELHEMGHKSFF